MSTDPRPRQSIDIEKVLDNVNTKLGKVVVVVAGYLCVQEVFKDNLQGSAGFGAIALGFALAVRHDNTRTSQENTSSEE